VPTSDFVVNREAFKAARLAKGLQQSDVAVRADVSEVSINRYENGDPKTGEPLGIMPSTARRIAKVLGVKHTALIVPKVAS
jgi:transcriptional regulator with XRE-family HTH domain